MNIAGRIGFVAGCRIAGGRALFQKGTAAGIGTFVCIRAEHLDFRTAAVTFAVIGAMDHTTV